MYKKFIPLKWERIEFYVSTLVRKYKILGEGYISKIYFYIVPFFSRKERYQRNSRCCNCSELNNSMVQPNRVNSVH